MNRLYVQVYATCVGIVALFLLLTALAWTFWVDRRSDVGTLRPVGALLAELLPPAEASGAELQEAVDRLADRLPVALAVHAPDGALLAAAGEPLPAPGPQRRRSGLIGAPGLGHAAALHLPDGRWLVARHEAMGPGPAVHLLHALLLLAVAIALGAYPVARRLTRRLERLQARVEALGGGDLSARVDVEGRDEVATLARSFNRTADRLQELVDAQRDLLASVSHELRSPLARLRVAAELVAEARPDMRERLVGEIEELDELIGELLLASRLETGAASEGREEIDLLGLVAEEAARTGANVEGVPASVAGDRILLRHLVRNLLENARRHAGGGEVSCEVHEAEAPHVVLRVSDRGPGVPEEERERIFEPFHRLPGAGDGGTGLGLLLVRRIARHHGGDARCLPHPGGGAIFEVTLRRG